MHNIHEVKTKGVIACVASVPVRSIRAAQKMRQEQKGGRKGVGEGKERNACPQTP